MNTDIADSTFSATAKQVYARRVRGFSLVSALFLLIVVAALGAFAVRISVGQQHTVNSTLLANRALAAANAGVEWGIHRALSGTCVAGTLNLTEAALNGFTVQVTCARTNHNEAGGVVRVYSLQAFAQFGVYGQPDYVSRRVRARFADEP